MSLLLPSRSLDTQFAQSFDGSTSNVILSSSATGAQAPLAQTILAFACHGGSHEGGFGFLFGQVPSASIDGPRLWMRTDDNTVNGGGSSTGASGGPYINCVVPAWVVGEWFWSAVTWNGGLTAASLTGYLGRNNQPIASLTTTWSSAGSGTAKTGTGNPLYVGQRTGGDRSFNGKIAYVARWNRVLTLGELRRAQRWGPLSVRNGLIMLWANGRDYGPYHLRPTSVTAVPKVALPPGRRVPLLLAPSPLQILTNESGGSGSTLNGTITETGSDTGTGTLSFQHYLNGTVTETGSDTGSGTVSAVHSLNGSITETGSDTGSGTISFQHYLNGTVTETGADTGSGSVTAGNDTYLNGTITETGSDTGSGTVSFQHYLNGTITETGTDTGSGSVSVTETTALNGSVTETGTDTASGSLAFQHFLNGLITESYLDTASGTLDNPEAEAEVIQTRGGAGKAKVKKKRSQKSVEVSTEITELIRNLESERIVDGVRVHTAKKEIVRKPPETSLEALRDDLATLLPTQPQKRLVEAKKPLPEPILTGEKVSLLENRIKSLESEVRVMKNTIKSLEELVMVAINS